MVWAKLDDGFPDHPKVAGLSGGAFRLHVSGICYATRLLTDGLVAAQQVPRLMPGYRPRFRDELVAKGLWHDENSTCSACPTTPVGTYFLHDFLLVNPSRSKVLAEREAAAERQRKARESRRDRQRDSQRTSGVSNGVSHGASHASPTRPDPLPTGERVGADAPPTPSSLCVDERCDLGWIANDPTKPDELDPCPTCRPALAGRIQ